jgi:hypothetical protein
MVYGAAALFVSVMGGMGLAVLLLRVAIWRWSR